MQGQQHHDELFRVEPMPPRVLIQAALFLLLQEQQAATGSGPWATLSFRRFGDVAQRTFKFDEHEVVIRVSAAGYEAIVDGASELVHGNLKEGTELVTQFSNTRSSCTIIRLGHKLHLFNSGRQYILHYSPSGVEADAETVGAQVADTLKTPMPATVIEVRVKPGEIVVEGQVCCVLESMKMEINIRAGRDGIVSLVNVEKGQVVEEGAVLVALEPQGESA
jgi:3-methylcrotonyl-CoA carboxylase alpha subunit